MAVSKAMVLYPEVKLDRLMRMADFTRWGYAIAEALGIGGNNFMKAYESNQRKINEEAISSHPVAAAVVALMRDTNKWKGTVANLLTALEFVAKKEKIDTYTKAWPGAAHVLSRKLKEVQSNLEQKNIHFVIRHNGDAKVVTIIKKAKDRSVPAKSESI